MENEENFLHKDFQLREMITQVKNEHQCVRNIPPQQARQSIISPGVVIIKCNAASFVSNKRYIGI